MTSYVPAKKGAEYIFYAGLVSQSTGQFQANPTIAAGDFKVSIDGGALANLATLPAVTPAASRMVKFTLSTSEMNGDNITVVGADAAGAEWDEIMVSIQTAVRQIDDLATPTNITAGTITTATNVTTVNGLAANVITAASMAADASAEIADAVWDEDATGHQTQGTFGQAIGDPVADTNTIYKAVVTDAAGATIGIDVVAVKAETASIQSDTNDIQTRLPAALSGDGFMKADLKSIEDELTSGNNATLNLKQLNIINSGIGEIALYIEGNSNGLFIYSPQGAALDIESGNNDAIFVSTAGSGKHAIHLGSISGKSINAPNDIAVSDGDLTLAAIAAAVWASVIETGFTALQSMRLMLSALAGKLSGAATTTVVIRDVNDTKDRITATVDADGNRTAVTKDVS
jgi:hypothetical protein